VEEEEEPEVVEEDDGALDDEYVDDDDLLRHRNREPSGRPWVLPMLVDVDLPARRDDTAAEVKAKLDDLRGYKIGQGKFSLNAQVHDRSRVALQWSDNLQHVSLFAPLRTGRSRPTQVFRRPHLGCQARLKFFIREGLVHIKYTKYMHTHSIETTSFRSLRSLSGDQKAQVRELTQRRASAQIHMDTECLVSPAVLQDISLLSTCH
jgi:hypothetical protein